MGDSKAVSVKKGRKRISKKNKIAWRKYAKTQDVEKFLDEFRLEERVGVHLSTAKDEKIFYVDDVPQEQIKSKTQRKLEAIKKLQGVPKCYEVFQPLTSVPDPIKRNRVRSIEERKHPIRKKVEALRKARGILTAKEKEAAKSRELHAKKLEEAAAERNHPKDIWSEQPKELPVDVQWFNTTTYRHVLKNTGKLQKRVPKTVINKPSALPSIQVPHPGMSYNPSYLDHQTLLEEIVDSEKKVIKADNHLNRVTSKMFSKVTPEEMQYSWIQEMSQGHPISETYIVKEEDENETSEYKALNPPTKDKKKTRKTRRNIRHAKQEENLRKIKAIEKKKVADIYKLKKIVQSVNEDEMKSLEYQAVKEEKKKTKELDAKRLSRLKFEDAEPEFNMPYDLSGNLRGMKPEGNLLRDRLKSLQKRNILQPTSVHRPKQGKKKVFTKREHK